MNTPAEIFLSYNREDQAVARCFAEGLQKAGFTVWWDVTLRSGDSYDQVTEKALRDAKAVVVLWSKRSVESRWVRAEATLADRNKTLMPVMIEVCERPLMFELIQTADLCHWRGDDGDTPWKNFLADVRRMVSHRSVAATPASVPPPALVPPSFKQDYRPSVAVLPFTNRSGIADDDVFAEGMVDDLITALSLSAGLKVISHSSTAIYRKSTSDLRSIGKELGVRYLLEGNVRRLGNMLRVTAQLVEADNSTILWIQKFDRPLSELAVMQEMLVTEVARHLDVQVERNEITLALEKPDNLNAWEALMRARHTLSALSRESHQIAIKETRRAVELAPRYALAHAELAFRLAAMNAYFYGGQDADIAKESRQHAEQAITLGSGDASVLGVVAVAFVFGNLWQAAYSYATRSLQLNPNVDYGRFALSVCCLQRDEAQTALDHIYAGIEMNPQGSFSYTNISFLALAKYHLGKVDEALVHVEQSLQLNPVFMPAWKDRAIYHESLGQHEAALAAMRWVKQIDPHLTLVALLAYQQHSFVAPRLMPATVQILERLWTQSA